jgi:hypothetical protein
MKCANCGQEYDDNENQCCECGSNVVDKRADDTLQIAVSEHARRGAWQEGKVVGFRESETSRQFSAAETHEDGTVSSRIQGRPIQGEGDTKPVGQVLAQAMSASGEQWEVADEPADGVVDCVLRDCSAPTRHLEVQVVRAIADPKLYQKLAAGQEVTEANIDPVEVAGRLFEAVTKKADRLPGQVRCGLILALDATRVSVCTMSSVIEEYRRCFGTQTRSLNFAQVWLVGPMASMTYRLDA